MLSIIHDAVLVRFGWKILLLFVNKPIHVVRNRYQERALEIAAAMSCTTAACDALRAISSSQQHIFIRMKQ